MEGGKKKVPEPTTGTTAEVENVALTRVSAGNVGSSKPALVTAIQDSRIISVSGEMWNAELSQKKIYENIIV